MWGEKSYTTGMRQVDHDFKTLSRYSGRGKGEGSRGPNPHPNLLPEYREKEKNGCTRVLGPHAFNHRLQRGQIDWLDQVLDEPGLAALRDVAIHAIAAEAD